MLGIVKLMAKMNDFENIQEGFEYISSTLESIKTQAAVSSGSTNKALLSINDQLDNLIGDDKELMNVFLAELKKSLDERHSFVSSKFEGIEDSFKTLAQQAEKQLQAEEVKEVFKIIANNLNTFSKDFSSQKDLIIELGLKLQELQQDDSQKKDILRNISVLKMEIEKFNNGFESIVYNLNDNFSEISQTILKLDSSEALVGLKKDIDSVNLSSNAILSTLQVIDRKNRELEEIITHVVTKDDFDIEKEQVAKLISQNVQITNYISNLPTANQVNSLTEKIDTSVGIINALKNMLSETGKQNQQLLTAQLNNLEAKITNISSEEEFVGFKKELVAFSQEITQSTNLMRADIEGTNTELKGLLAYLSATNIKESFENFATFTKAFEANIQKGISSVYENLVGKLGQNKDLTKKDIDGGVLDLTKKLDLLKTAVLDDSKFNLASVLENIQTIISNILSSKNELHLENVDNLKALEERLRTIKEELLDSNSTIVKTSKDNFVNLSSLISDLSIEINGHKENLKESAKDNFDVISSYLQSLNNQLLETRNHIVEDLQSNFSSIKSSISELPTIIKENQSIFENENKALLDENSKTFEQIGDKIQNLIQGFVAKETPFKDGILNEIYGLKLDLEKIKEEVGHSNQETGEKIGSQVASLIQNIEDLFVQYDLNYNAAMLGLQNKIVDYFKSIQNNNQENELKLDNSLKVTSEIKTEVESLIEELSELKNDSRLGNLAIEIGQKFQEISSKISYTEEVSSSKTENASQNILEVLKENFAVISGELKSNQNILSMENGEVFEEISSKIEKIQSQINLSGSETINELVEKTEEIVSSAKETLVDSLKYSIQSVSSSVLNKIDSSEEAYKSSIQSLFTEVQEQLAERLDKSSRALSESKNDFNNFSDEIKNSIDELKEIYADLNSSSTTELTNILLSVQDRVEEIGTTVENIDFEKVAREVKNKISEIDFSQSVEDSKKELTNILMNQFENIGQKLELLNSDIETDENIKDIQRMLQSQNNFITNLEELPSTEIITEEIAVVKYEVKKNLENFEAKLDTLIAAKDDDKTLAQELKTDLSAIKEDLLSGIFDVVNQISFMAEAEDIKEFVTNKSEAITTEIKEFFNNKSAGTKSEIKNIVLETAEDITTNVKNAVQSSLDNNINSIVFNVEKLQEKSSENIQNYVDEKTQEIKESFRNTVGNSIGNNFNDILTSLDTLHEETTIHIKDFIERKMEESSQFAEDTKEYIKEFIVEKEEKTKDFLEKIVDEQAQETKSYSEEIKNYIQHFVNEKAQESNIYSEKIQEEIRSFISESADETKASSEEVKNYIQSFFINKAEETKTQIQELIEVKTDSIKENLKNSLEENFDEILASLDVLNEKTNNFVEEFVNEKAEETKLYSEETKEYISHILDVKAEETKADIKDSFQSSLNKNFGHIMTNLNTLQEKTVSVDSGYNTLVEEVKEIKERILSVADDIKGLENDTEVTEKLQNLGFDVEKTRELLQDFVDEKIEESKENIKDSIQNAVAENFNLILTNIDSLQEKSNDIDANYSSLFNEITSVRNEISSMSDGIKSAEESTEIADAIEKVETNIEELKGLVKDFVETNEQGIGEDIAEDIKDNIEKAITGNVNSILSNLSTLHEKTENVDLNYITLLNEIQEVKNKVSSIKEVMDDTEDDSECLYTFENIESDIEEVKVILKDFIEEKTQDSKDEIKSSIEEKTQEVQETLQSLMSEKFVTILSNLDTLREDADKTDSNHSDVIEEMLEIKGKISSLMDEIKSVGDQTDFSNTLQGVESNVEEVKILLQDFIEEKSEDTKDDIKSFVDEKSQEVQDNIQTVLSEKIDSILSGLNSLGEKNTDAIKEFVDEKLESSALTSDEIKTSIAELKETYVDLSLNSTMEMSGLLVSIQDKITEVESKVGSFDFENIIETSKNEITQAVEESKNGLSETLAEKLDTIGQKLDLLVEDSDSETEENIKDIQRMVQSQGDLIAKLEELSSAEKTVEAQTEGITDEIAEELNGIKNELQDKLTSFETKLNDLFDAKIESEKEVSEEASEFDSSTATNEGIKADLDTLKEDLLESILSVFGEISFVAETEEIKDYVNEKAEEAEEAQKSLQQSLDSNFSNVLSSINNISNNLLHAKADINEERKPITENEYSYTLQDVESDIAKLRLVLNDIAAAKQEKVVVEPIGDLDKLNEAITSVSTRTNKLLLTSDESHNALKSNLDVLRNVVSQFEEKVKDLDNKDSIARIEQNLENINNLTLSNVKSNQTFNQTFMYLAEWVDNASENFETIIDKVEEVDKIKQSIVELKQALPKKSDIKSVLDGVSEQFNQQQQKIDSLEEKIEKLVKKDKSKEIDIDEIVEKLAAKLNVSASKPDVKLAKKVDNIDKQIAKLAKGIEKLSSYVD